MLALVGSALLQDITEDGVECLHHAGACRGHLGDFLRDRGLLAVGQPVERSIEGVADVDDDLAREGVSVLDDDRNDTVVQQGRDDDVPCRDGAPLSRRRAAAESLGQVIDLGLIAAHDLDGVAARDRQRADGTGHVPRTDDGDIAHDVCSLPVLEVLLCSCSCRIGPQKASCRRAWMKTCAPSSTNSLAPASVMPVDPPVITATLPSSFPTITPLGLDAMYTGLFS